VRIYGYYYRRSLLKYKEPDIFLGIITQIVTNSYNSRNEEIEEEIKKEIISRR
jgi:hypothetical protein